MVKLAETKAIDGPSKDDGPEVAEASSKELKAPALVKLRRPFYHKGRTYPASRFGVTIPAGVILPSDAEILSDVDETDDIASGDN